jgi:N-acetylglucosaminyl-diphospho-decaprenol L-rhamnosyltransferase
MEIIVIDNHSDTDAIGILRNRLGHLPTVRIVETNRNAGFGGGYSVGIRQATGKYLLINNPAKILEPGALELMIKRIESDPTIGIIAPKLVHEDGSIRSSARAFPRLKDVIIKRSLPGSDKSKHVRRYLQSDVSPDQERETDWVIGGCMLMRREVMEAVGGFDPRFFLFFEDIDLCRRVRQTGKSILYFPQAIATDKKQRLSEMPLWRLPFKKAGRAHISSALKYFWKWKMN